MDCMSYGALTFAIGFLLGGAVMFAVMRSMYYVLLKVPTSIITPADMAKMLERDRQIEKNVALTRTLIDKIST